MDSFGAVAEGLLYCPGKKASFGGHVKIGHRSIQTLFYYVLLVFGCVGMSYPAKYQHVCRVSNEIGNSLAGMLRRVHQLSAPTVKRHKI
jgi:hypothetical protein